MDTAKTRILVTDDDPSVLIYTNKTLGSAGFDVFTCSSGEQAIEIAATNEIDLALLDFRMSGLSGLDTSRALYELTATRFILMSAYPDRDLVMQAANDGALEFLAKPLRRDSLINTVTICAARAAEMRSKEKLLNDMKDHYNEAVSRGLSAARSVNTAIGILMEQHRKNRTDAYAILMRLACNERRRAVDLSEEIIRDIETRYPSSS